MAKQPTDQSGEFQRRPGAAPFGPSSWRGKNSESDPGALQPNELLEAINVRLRGSITARSGMSQVINLGAPNDGENQIMWMGEAPVANPRIRLWLSARGCLGAGIPTGSSVFRYDPTEVPPVQSYAGYQTTADFQTAIGKFGGDLYIGDRDTLRKVTQITSHSATKTADFLFAPSAIAVAKYTGFTIRCLKEFNGKLFVGLENNTTPASSKIAVYNGLSTKDDLTGVRPPVNFGVFQERLLVCGFDATAGHIRYRAVGDAPGTWTTVALAGYQTATQGNAMIEDRQYLYIAGGADKIYRFDGSALTLAQTIAGCDTTTGYGVTCLAQHRGIMYYGWNTPTPNFLARIGRHDPDSTGGGTEWRDTMKDLTADQANFKKISAMLSYRSQLVCGGLKVWLVATAVDDVQGTLAVLNNTGAPGAGFNVDQMVRYP